MKLSMKDRIGQSNKKKKTTVPAGVSSVTGVPTPDTFAGFSAEDEMPPKKSPLPAILCVILVVALAAAGAWYFIGHRGSKTPPAAVSKVEYPLNTAQADEQQQALKDVIVSAKEQKIPTITQLVDLIAINELTGKLESDKDGKNANITAQLTTESLAQKAADFQTSSNDDTVGWIQIPNTNVDYPVVYKAGEENYAYYEAKGYDKNYSRDGVIWADFECSFPQLADNTILYGHNWNNVFTPRTMKNMNSNDTMFALVMSYHHTDFAQENPFIYFSTTERDYVYQVFASFYTDLKFGYNFAEMDQEQFQQVIAEAKAKSRVNYNVPVTTEDQILTLSTCTRFYGNTSNQRFVVMAKLVPEGTPSTTISSHTNPIAYNAKISAN